MPRTLRSGTTVGEDATEVKKPPQKRKQKQKQPQTNQTKDAKSDVRSTSKAGKHMKKEHDESATSARKLPKTTPSSTRARPGRGGEMPNGIPEAAPAAPPVDAASLPVRKKGTKRKVSQTAKTGPKGKSKAKTNAKADAKSKAVAKPAKRPQPSRRTRAAVANASPLKEEEGAAEELAVEGKNVAPVDEETQSNSLEKAPSPATKAGSKAKAKAKAKASVSKATSKGKAKVKADSPTQAGRKRPRTAATSPPSPTPPAAVAKTPENLMRLREAEGKEPVWDDGLEVSCLWATDGNECMC